MKKLLAVTLMFVTVTLLSACGLLGGETEVDCLENPNDPACQQIVDCLVNPEDPSCQEEVDCLLNPDDPECQVDCDATPDDPECQVDCNVTPNDPACQVDCNVTPDDPECQVDCSVTPDDPECQVDCSVTPDDPECQVDCSVTPNDPECQVDCSVTPDDPECQVDCNVTPDDPECDTRTPEEIAVDLIIEGWQTGDTTHMGIALSLMDFSQALTLTQTVQLEITEDVDEVHYIDATIIDKYVYNETTGTIMERHITLDVDTEFMVDFTMYLVEVPTGVHVYIEKGPIIDTLSMGDPNIIMIAETLGFNNDWALFKFDDSLANVVQIEVLKDMIVDLFFSEMGENFFYDVQEQQIEMIIGFDLTQYGVDLGQFIDYVIEEDFTNAELLLQGIEPESILLHADYLHLAWRLNEFLQDYLVDLAAAGFDITKVDKLDTATWNETTQMMEIDPLLLPVDPLDLVGTKAFFESLTETEIDSLIEIVIKPILEQIVYDQYLRDANPDWLDNDFRAILESNEQFLIDNWPMSSGTYDPVAELALFDSLGAVAYFQQLTFEERDVLHWAIDMNNHGWVVWELRDMTERDGEWMRWFLVRYEEEVDIYWLEGEWQAFVNDNWGAIQTLGHDPQFFIDQIINEGPHWFYHNAPEDVKQLLKAYVETPGNEHMHDAFYQVEHMAQNPWEYNHFFRNWEGDFLDNNWIQQDLIDLINMHQTYLFDEYGIDAAGWIQEINDYGAIEWYMWQTDDFTREVLNEISHFGGSQDHYRWVIQRLEEVNDRQWDYFWWFGRAREMQDIDDLTWQTTMFLQDFQNDALLTMYPVSQWINDIESFGVLEWYQTLTQEQLEALQQVAQNNENWYEHAWVIFHLGHITMNMDQYQWCYGEWNHCIDPQHITDEMILLLQQYEQYLIDEYGWDVQGIITQLQTWNAMDWYWSLDDYDREILIELAEMSHWGYEVLWMPEKIMYMEDEFLYFLQQHQLILEGYGFDVSTMITDLETVGIQVFVSDYLTPADVEMLLEAAVYPKIEGLRTAIENDEIQEFLMFTVFTDPHVLMNFAGEPVLQTDIFLDNIILIDFDAWYVEMETFDIEILANVIYGGQAAFDAYILTLETTHPNMALWLEPFRAGVLELEAYMYIVDDVIYVLDNIEPLLLTYTEMQMYLDEDIMNMELEKTDDFELITRMSVTENGYVNFLEMALEDVYWFLYGIEALDMPYVDPINCPALEDCEVMEGYDNMLEMLGMFGPLHFEVQYDPTDLDHYSYKLDFADMIQSIIDINLDQLPEGHVHNEYNDIWTGVNHAYIMVTVEEGAVITVPTQVDDVNEIAENFARATLVMDAYNLLMEMADYYAMNPGELVTDAGQQIPFRSWYDRGFQFSMSMDHDMSYSEAVVGLENDFVVQFYWLDGTEVFDAPIALSDFASLLTDEFPNDAAAYQTVIDLIDEDNFALTKLWLYYIMGETGRWDDHYYDEN